MPAECTIPVFHATDSYRKHHKKLKALYDEVWPELAIQANAATPKGDALRAELHPYGGSNGFCSVTGEPMHDIINLRRVASRAKNDYWDLVSDHADMINRLSSPAAGPGHCDPGTGPQLPKEAVALLKTAVEQPRDAVERAVDANDAAANSLRGFLRHPGVRRSVSWTAIFGADPPRGTLARLAKRFGVELAPSCQAYAWGSKDEFASEVALIRQWYATGRRACRPRLGMRRTRLQKARVKGVNCVMTQAVRKHYRKLLDPTRLEGLWHWREIADALSGAGIGVQSGTVPVERLWASLKGMFPQEARRMSMPWFNLLAKLTYFRYNYRHFHCKASPAWTEEDSLLAERLDDIRASLFPDSGCDVSAPVPGP